MNAGKSPPGKPAWTVLARPVACLSLRIVRGLGWLLRKAGLSAHRTGSRVEQWADLKLKALRDKH